MALVYANRIKFFARSSEKDERFINASSYYEEQVDCTLYFNVSELAISSNYLVAAAGSNGVEVIKLIKDGRNLRLADEPSWPACLAQTFQICSLAFSDDAKHLIVATTDGRVGVWSTAFQSPQAEWNDVVRQGRISDVSIASSSTSGLRAVVVTWDGTLNVFDDVLGSPTRRIFVPSSSSDAVDTIEAPGFVVVSRDGERAAVACARVVRARLLF